MDGEARDPLQVFQEDDPPTVKLTTAARTSGAQPRRYMLAMIMWKRKKNEKRIARQVGEIDQQCQGGQVQNGLQEDVLLRVDLAGGRVGLVPKEGQVIAHHGQGDKVQRQRLGDHCRTAEVSQITKKTIAQAIQRS